MRAQCYPAPEIWIVGKDHWPRALLRAELIERGYEVVGFAALRDALTRLTTRRGTAPALLIIDLHEQAATNRLLDPFSRRGCALLAIFGTGSDPSWRRYAWSATLKRPITLGDVATMAEGLVQKRLTTGPKPRRGPV